MLAPSLAVLNLYCTPTRSITSLFKIVFIASGVFLVLPSSREKGEERESEEMESLLSFFLRI